MGDHLRANIEDGKVVKIKCMAYKCEHVFERSDIQAFGSSDILQKYLKFKENIDIEMDPNIKWCVAKDCAGFARRGKRCLCCSRRKAFCELC